MSVTIIFVLIESKYLIAFLPCSFFYFFCFFAHTLQSKLRRKEESNLLFYFSVFLGGCHSEPERESFHEKLRDRTFEDSLLKLNSSPNRKKIEQNEQLDLGEETFRLPRGE